MRAKLSAPGCAHRLPLDRAALARAHAPSSIVPLRFLSFGLLSLVLATIWLAVTPEMLLHPHQTPHTIAWAHLFILGFALSIVLGALYQIAPVALEVRLFSERLAAWHSGLHVLGVTFMVPMFFLWQLEGVGLAALLLIAGAILFAFNLFRTLIRVARVDAVALSIAFSLLWLLATMALGLAMTRPELRLLLPHPGGDWLAAHAHLGLGGVFLNLIIGISFRLLPMFTLSRIISPFRTWLACLGINLGIAGLFLAVGTDHPQFALGCGALIAVALAIALGEMAAIFRARQRRRIDWGLRMFLVAVGLLVPLIALGLVASLSPPGASVRSLYAFLALFGVIGLAIIGMLHKILPFLVWYAVYSPLVGRAPVPSLSGMVSEPLQRTTFFACITGLGLALVGIALGQPTLAAPGIWLWGIGIGAFAINAGRILNHLRYTPPLPSTAVELPLFP